MPRASVEIESNLEDAVKTVKNLQGEIPTGADDAAKRIAKEWDKTGKMIMMKRGNVVTGTGMRNMKVSRVNDGVYGVYGPSYLQVLDTGRSAGTFPDTNNPRFIAAARSYGIPRQTLARSIAQKGTKPYPWIDEATRKVQRNAPKRVKIAMSKAVKDSVGVL